MVEIAPTPLKDCQRLRNTGVLAVHYENPFTHPQVTANIKNSVKALDVYFKKALLSLSEDERPEVMLTKGILGMLRGVAENLTYLKS